MPPAHGSVPVIAYAVQLGSVASRLHPLTFSLAATTEFPVERGCSPHGWYYGTERIVIDYAASPHHLRRRETWIQHHPVS